MALHPDFPHSPHAIADPAVRWFPADETLRDTAMDKLMPLIERRGIYQRHWGDNLPRWQLQSLKHHSHGN
ncbi:MAG: hypothetical protein EBE86_033485 [Hormoscilla sp. GUM202]|nr:hypothetical protein [Hormoscilla sp. GUM202]